MLRIQTEIIKKDLSKKMVFLSGPRQVGKTWLAKHIAALMPDSLYLNYDHGEDRDIIKKEAWLDTTKLLILDELHKMDGWKNYIKGVFDTKPKHMQLLITGSARLEAFRQSGDSLAGRFFRQRLLPFSPAELYQLGEEVNLDRMLDQGGFPEPFLAENPVDADRWRNQYLDGLIRNDILDFENIHDLKAMNLLVNLLRSRTGSPVSFSSLAEDIQVAPNTVKKYISVLESLFIIFRVSPFANNIARSILKDAKIYFFDTGLIKGDEGPKFENLVALSLFKHVCGLVDLKGQEYSLHYLRTKDQKEVDFCIVKDSKPELMIEAKRANPEPARSLMHFNRKYDIPATQVVMHLKREKKEKNIAIRRGKDYLSALLI